MVWMSGLFAQRHATAIPHPAFAGITGQIKGEAVGIMAKLAKVTTGTKRSREHCQRSLLGHGQLIQQRASHPAAVEFKQHSLPVGER